MKTTFAFVFPGQGSQFLGMLSQLAERFCCVEETFSSASEVLGYDLWQVTQSDKVRLDQTEVTQPAMLAADIAVFRCWQSLSQSLPVVMAGHSLGEFSALVAAESLCFEQAVSLVAKRGQFMQQAVPVGVGAMAAIIGLEEAEVDRICAAAAEGQILSPANFNAIGQTVVAGESAAVERAIVLAKAASAKMAKLIPVSVPSHCLLMKTAAENFCRALSTVAIKPPVVPVIHNSDVATHSEPEAIRRVLVDQLISPVRWVETIHRFTSDYGAKKCFECGPGKVLTGLIKRTNRLLVTVPLTLDKALEQEVMYG